MSMTFMRGRLALRKGENEANIKWNNLGVWADLHSYHRPKIKLNFL